jgi:hypothetical protein
MKQSSLALVVAVALAASGTPASSSPQDELIPGLELYDGPVGVVIPQPGFGVHISAYGELGSAELDVSTDLDGNVHVSHAGPDTGITVPQSMTLGLADWSLASPGPCEDTRYNHNIWRWFDSYRWYFRSGSTPSEIGQNVAELEFFEAADEVVNATRCGLADDVSAEAPYGGRASNADDIYVTTDPDGTRRVRCDDAADLDGASVVGFGNLPIKSENATKNYLAVTCTWRRSMPVPYLPAAYQSDQRVNKEDFRWGASPMPEGCGKFSLQAVATHEFGHTFSLAHVSEANHGKLTMSTANNGPCTDGEETFGKGDVLGMQYRY